MCHAVVPLHVVDFCGTELEAGGVSSATIVVPPFEEHGVEATGALEGRAPHLLVVTACAPRCRLQYNFSVGPFIHGGEDIDGRFALPLRFTELCDDESVNGSADGG